MIAELLGRSRLVVALVVLASLVGLASWILMPRQEDPSFANRYASVVVPFPGASAPDVERLIVEPLEDALSEENTLREIRFMARSGVAVGTLRLTDSVGFDETDAAWSQIRQTLDDAVPSLPEQALEPLVDTEVGDPVSVVYILSGPAPLLDKRTVAKRLQDRLRRVRGVERVELLGDPGRQVSVTLAPEMADQLGISAGALAAELAARNVTVPGGDLVVEGRSLVLRHRGELTDLDQIRQLPLRLQGDSTVPLGSVAQVELTPSLPRTSRVVRNGDTTVGLSVVAVPEQDLVAFGGRVREAVQSVEMDGLTLEEFSFQPDLVESRIWGLTSSLLLGIGIVALVLFSSMGIRMGAVVSSIVPLVALATVGVYAVGGGVLHQISIAALVLALGLLVDNAIVVAETVQQHLDAGSADPAGDAVRELGVPLGTATGTTVAAFLPMLLASGGTAEFTRTIPLLVILALVLSYVYALLVTPMLAGALLVRGSGETGRVERLGGWLAGHTVRRPWWVLAGAGVLLTGSAGLSRWVTAEFFPYSDRQELMVSVALAEGTHPAETERVVTQMVRDFSEISGVEQTTAFLGGGLPRFYYNLNDSPRSPHAAEIVLGVPGADLDVLAEEIAARARSWPEAEVVSKRLQQGPPVGSPVQIGVSAPNPESLTEATRAITKALAGIAGTRSVRNDLGIGTPTLDFVADDAWTGRVGSDRTRLALTTLAQTQGLAAGAIRDGSDPIPVRVVSSSTQQTSVDDLSGLSVNTAVGPIPLGQLSRADVRWLPSSIRHFNGRREALVAAQLAPGATYSSVMNAFDDLALALPAGVETRVAGDAEGSSEANGAILATLPIGLGALLFFLLLEFDSLRRLGIILATVPLAAVGVVPGLALTGQPFGFMSTLGLLALVGIVVNNAIVLINRVERNRREGASVDAALQDAVSVRIRPILLTTATTVAGMLPLAFSGSALWPPLAWAMISGLLASTMLTLAVVPALYRVCFGSGVTGGTKRRWPLIGLLLPSMASATPMGLDEVMAAAERAPTALAAHADARGDRLEGAGSWLDALAPTVTGAAEYRSRNEAVELDTPLGPFVQQPKRVGQVGMRVTQPVFAPAGWALAGTRSHGARASAASADRESELVALAVGELYLDVVDGVEALGALESQRDALVAVSAVAVDAWESGLVTETDALTAAVALSDVEVALARTAAEVASGQERLGAVLGLDEPVEVGPVESVSPRRSSRPDLRAARSAADAAATARWASAAQLLPTLAVDAGWQATDNEALVQKSWSDVGIAAQWRFGVGRVADASAAEARRVAGQHRVEALERGREAEIRALRREVEVWQAAVETRELAVVRAAEVSRQLRDRYAAGLIVLSEVLRAEAVLAESTVALSYAKTGGTRAVLRLAAAGGAVR